VKLRTVAVASALAAGFCAMSALAATADQPDTSRETELRRFRFEQMLAFMRARGDKMIPRSPYEPMPQLQLPTAKQQFERAGGKLVAPSTLSPSDQLLEQAVAKTYQKMLIGGGCCPCTTAATCADGLFCNGAEICSGGLCAPGPAACNDGNACTNDSCVETTDTCSHSTVPPPAEVVQLNLGRSAPLSPVATLTWSAATGASTYNIYRGTSANLTDLACFLTGQTGLTHNDDGALPVHAFFYLVTSKAACGESGLGLAIPTPRRSPPGCP
jgi:hypothetical protein